MGGLQEYEEKKHYQEMFLLRNTDIWISTQDIWPVYKVVLRRGWVLAVYRVRLHAEVRISRKPEFSHNFR